MNITTLVAAFATAALASACVVVPLGPDGRPLANYGNYGNYANYPIFSAGGAVAAAPLIAPAPTIAVMNARLYPANEQAQPSGLAVGQVTNFLDGKGAFSVLIAGEQFTGEATRSGRTARDGIANAMGSRGNTMSCTYVLNNPTQGSGQCSISTGARYQLHLGG